MEERRGEHWCWPGIFHLHNSVLDDSPLFFIESRKSRMRILPKVLWILSFIAATFFWMVLFEHGFTMKGLTEGTREELHGIAAWFGGGKK